ncbi:MAG TPA: SGNH/GDSL hydrolase family protein [Pirellulales bacterium]|nr:SGNH/GDSL hydrolase family protein [Pirellulales bacterium]
MTVVADPAQGDPAKLSGVHRVVFLGDSITHSGQYIDFFETVLRLHQPQIRCDFLNLGLPSETVSGLSEPGHAGGKFPRPDLHERLDRVLAQTKPDLVIACYGMNCGIYHPFSDLRFAQYQAGLEYLYVRATMAGAALVLITPPTFDPMPIRAKTLPAGLDEYRSPYEGYNDVLDRYAQWLLDQRQRGWDVVDAHGPMNTYLAKARERDPSLVLARDGVHIDATGHWLIAKQLLLYFDIDSDEVARADSIDRILHSAPHGNDVLTLVRERNRLLRDAWVSATGHKRPGMKQGLALDEALAKAKEIDTDLRKLTGSM